MLVLQRHGRSVEAVLAGPALTAEQMLEINSGYRQVLLAQEHPDLALIATTGLMIPVHERIMLYEAHRGTQTNVFIGSRGTSKSTAVDVFYPAYAGLFYTKRRSVLLSATGFRGGQLLFTDFEKLVKGDLDGQESGLEFYARSLARDKIIHRAQNFWQIEYDTGSSYATFPTNDPEKLRGIRGMDLFLDESNTMDYALVETVSLPFLNVKGGFRSGGLDASKNRVFYTTTIDYSWRWFNDTAEAAQTAVERDQHIMSARRTGDTLRATELAKDGFYTTTFVNIDYTDTLIRSELRSRATGQLYRINYPRHALNERFRFVDFPGGIPFTVRTEIGDIEQDAPPVRVLQTYPLDIDKIEEKLRDGTGSVSSWLSEQRNLKDSAVGDVYPNHVIDKAASSGDRCVIPFSKLPTRWKSEFSGSEEGYAPNVLWSCADPCVLGVDYAGGDRDFSALVVIRLGPLAVGDFDPYTGCGKTDWSNVIWAEMHRLTSHEDVAEKIHEYKSRYNLAYNYEEWETDTWKLCRALGLDMKGGGTGVRDALAKINQKELGAGEVRIYDPLDPDERILAFKDEPTSLPMLDAIMPSDSLNEKLVEFTLGQMQQGLLFLPKVLNDGKLNIDRRLRIGLNGAEALTYQLRKLQGAPTKNYTTYFMKGDKEKVENKKDLWAAFIYAAKQARAHLIRQRAINDAPPPMGALRARVNVKRVSNGRAAGSKL